MTWIACNFCRTMPCICAHTVRPPPPILAPTHYHFTPAAQPLSDADIERIAKRLAELLAKPRNK